MVEILITGSRVIVNEEEIIKDGYVFVKNGTIEDFGQQPPPEDYTYASLVLGGEGRIVAPGLTALASPISYVLRFYRPSIRRRIELLKTLTLSERALLSLAGIYELHLSGVTTMIIEGIDYGYLAKIKDMAGGNYGLAFPSCEGEPPEKPEWSVGMLRIADRSCMGRADVVEKEELWLSSEGSKVLSFINKSFWNLHGMHDVLRGSNRLRRILGLGDVSIRRKASAEVIIYDVRRPPAMLLDMAPNREIMSIYSSGARIESVIVGEDVLVDGGEHLYIVDKQFKDIRKLISRILQNI